MFSKWVNKNWRSIMYKLEFIDINGPGRLMPQFCVIRRNTLFFLTQKDSQKTDTPTKSSLYLLVLHLFYVYEVLFFQCSSFNGCVTGESMGISRATYWLVDLLNPDSLYLDFRSTDCLTSSTRTQVKHETHAQAHIY